MIGATGLTGSMLTEKLLADPDYSSVTTLVRRPAAVEHRKLTQIVIDFTDEPALKEYLQGDVLFCCVGTTIKTAGSRERFLQVDYDIPVTCGTIAASNGIGKMVLISSVGADALSGNFYLQTKGRVEEALAKLPFTVLHIFQPGVLMGQRKEVRTGEKIAILLSPLINLLLFGPLAKYKGIRITVLTDAMANVAKKAAHGVIRYTYPDILKIVNKPR